MTSAGGDAPRRPGANKTRPGGRITRPDLCSRCGAEDEIQAHHPDYTKPLSVDWLCPPCHAKVEAAKPLQGLPSVTLAPKGPWGPTLEAVGSLRMTYSPTADALAVRLASWSTEVRTRELGPGIHAHFDERGRLVGIEVLDASTHYPRVELEELAAPVEYLTLAEAAKESKLAAATLKAQIRNERLAAIKRGRDWLVARHELWNYLESRATQGRPARKRAARKARRDLAKASSAAKTTGRDTEGEPR